MSPAYARAACSLLLALAASFVSVAAAGAAPSVEPEHAAIVNGDEVSDARFASTWPFLVAVIRSGARSQYEGQFCAGTLVDDQHVVTAAHCLVLEQGVTIAPTGVRIVARTALLDTDGSGSGETGLRVVTDAFVHPGFAENDGDGFRNDVAVLRLAQPVSGTTTLPLVQAGEQGLWGSGAGGPSAMVAGWGDTDPLDRMDPDLKFPARLREATIPLRSDALCASTVGGGYGTAFERASNLCAGSLQSGSTLGTDACQGDSGGPLTVGAPDGTRRLAGITSWGEGCGARTFGVYSRVDALRGWIDSIPGATDGGAAFGGPGGTQAVGNVRRVGSSYTRMTLAWDAPTSGTVPERYGVWRRQLIDGERAEALQGITTSTSFRARVTPTRRDRAYAWVVRPLDAAGSAGPGTLLRSGPRPDLHAPGMSRLWLTMRGPTAFVARWTLARDRQSGVAAYELQRRLVDRGGRWSRVSRAPDSRGARVDGLPRGERVQLRVRAIDRAGNVGPWSMVRTFRTLR